MARTMTVLAKYCHNRCKDYVAKSIESAGPWRIRYVHIRQLGISKDKKWSEELRY
ncbi:hypothetical protein HPP92_007738 [Vanilla planifolia]|uniref:Uncharacterized protein n=1 Tax=Vanilla planifolia TaxID=51239 RepID=A0A835RMD1_VANPL|nr:hypothetical protein HPP92_007738 [Vanilla planifolia]